MAGHRSAIGDGDRLDRDDAPSAVAEVVGVNEFRDAAIDQRADPHCPRGVASVPEAVPFGFRDGIALPSVRESAVSDGLPFILLDAQAGNAITLVLQMAMSSLSTSPDGGSDGAASSITIHL